MDTKIPTKLALAFALTPLSACEPDFDVDEEAALAADALALEMTALAVQAEDLQSGASQPVVLGNSCPENATEPCSALSLFDDNTNNTSHLRSLDDHAGAVSYENTPPNNQDKQWIMGDWDGDGLDSPGYYISGPGHFHYTNTPDAPAQSWSSPLSISDGYAMVAGHFRSNCPNDCVGMIIEAGNNWKQDTIYHLEYWCDLPDSQSPECSDGAQWIGAVLPDSSFPAGLHEFVAGDWDGDGIDEIAIRKDRFIAYSMIEPEAGPATFPQAQRWGVPPGELPATGVFVSGDWNGDGTDGWGVLYDDNHFFYRNDLAWEPGTGVYHLQHIDNLYSSRDVSSHQLDLQ